MGHARKDDFPSPAEPGEGVGNDTTDSDLQVAGHHLSIDRDRCALARFAKIGTEVERVMVVNRKTVEYLPAKFLFEVNRCVCAVGPQGRNKTDLAILDPGLPKLF